MDIKNSFHSFVFTVIAVCLVVGIAWLCMWGFNESIKRGEEGKRKVQQEKKVCEELKEIENIPIHSFDLTSQGTGEFRGNFAYSSGTYEEELYYLFYEILEDGGKVIKKIPAENSILYNDEEVSPYIEKIKTCQWSDGWYRHGNYKEIYKIHIPSNSLKSDYTGDLSKVSGK